MRTALLPGQWLVFGYEPHLVRDIAVDDELLVANRDRLALLAEGGSCIGRPFLIGPDGRADARVNGFFSSPRMRSRSPLTWAKYAQSLSMWFNFLHVLGRSWDEATVDDAESFKEWRITDSRNPSRVEPSTFVANLAALRSFYRWAAPRFGVVDPVAGEDDFDLAPRGARRNRVKWLDPAGYRRWRDLGLGGMSIDGRPDPAFRGRNEQRDCAFADGLYGSGLRLSEWASVVLPELSGDDPGRGYSTCRLADACAKGGYGHVYWLPRHALVDVLNYVEGARARIVRAAQRAGRYDVVDEKGFVLHSTDRDVVLRHSDGTQRKVSLNTLNPARRRALYRMTKQGPEPLALWLNEHGQPRLPHSWEHTFQGANKRIAKLGLTNFTATPHMLRHSCALRWFAIGRLAYEKRFAHLTEEETKDFRQQFGDTWDLVAAYLGHRNPETTKRIYLEPFRALDVEILLQHVQDSAVQTFLADYLADHPLVRTDPLRRNP